MSTHAFLFVAYMHGPCGECEFKKKNAYIHITWK